MQTGLIQILPDDESTDSMTEGYSDDDYDDHHPATVHHHHHQQPQSLPANIVFVSGDYSMALTDLFAGDEAQSAEVESGGEGGETSENDTLAVD
jgi:hypothetical protein